MNRYIIYIGLLLFLGKNATAQSLDSLLSGILTADPGIQAARLEFEAERAEASQTGYLPDPEIGVGFFVSPVETRVGPQQFRAGVSQMFPWKGTLEAQRNIVLTNARLGREKIQARKLDVIYEGKMAWYDLYELEALIELEEQNIRIYEALESFALTRVESGEGSLADVLRVQLKKEATVQHIRELHNQKQVPLAIINALLNRPDTVGFFPKGIFSEAKSVIDPSELDSLLNTHPRVRSLEIRREEARQRMRLSELERKPVLGLGMDYVVVGERDVADLEDNGQDIIMPRVMARIPINQKRYDAVDQEQELRMAAAGQSIQAVKRSMESTIRWALTQYKDAELKMVFYENQREKTRAAIDILESRYSSEGQGFDELLQMRIDLIQFDIDSLLASIDQYRALARIEYLLTSQIKDYE